MPSAPSRNVSAAPYVVPPTNRFEGNDGSWSTFYVIVGASIVEDFRVLVSTASSLTWLIDAAGCTSSDPSNCPNLRGVEPYAGTNISGYNASESHSFEVGLIQLDLGYNLPFSEIYGGQYVGINATIYEDAVGPGQNSNTSLQFNDTFASVASKEIFLGEFGLGRAESDFGTGAYQSLIYLMAFGSTMPIPSVSYGYTAGASYRKLSPFISLQTPNHTGRIASDTNFERLWIRERMLVEEMEVFSLGFLPFLP